MITIREATKEDAQQIMAHAKKMAETNPLTVMLPQELNHNLDKERIQLERHIQDGGLMLVAEHDQEIIGVLSLQVQSIQRFQHIATMAIEIQEEYCNQGLGKQMLTHMMNWAKQNPKIEKICLHVLSSNERAIHVYQKMGFVEEGRRIDHIKMGDADYVDDVLMYMKV